MTLLLDVPRYIFHSPQRNAGRNNILQTYLPYKRFLVGVTPAYQLGLFYPLFGGEPKRKWPNSLAPCVHGASRQVGLSSIFVTFGESALDIDFEQILRRQIGRVHLMESPRYRQQAAWERDFALGQKDMLNSKFRQSFALRFEWITRFNSSGDNRALVLNPYKALLA